MCFTDIHNFLETAIKQVNILAKLLDPYTVQVTAPVIFNLQLSDCLDRCFD